MKNKQKTIFITGASSGIGKDIAVSLAKLGHKVFAGVRKKIDKQMLESAHSNIKGVYIDITNNSSIDKAFWFVYKNTTKLDALINNAGIVVAGPVECIDVNNLKEQFEVNTFGAIRVVQKFMPLLENSKVINISSMASFGIFPYISPYCASKRALDIIFNSFALENKSNIKVVSIKPSSVKTPIWNKSVEKAKTHFENNNLSQQEKYKKEFLFLEKNAIGNNSKGIDVKKVTDRVINVINSKNPKPSYTVGFQAFVSEIVSSLPQNIINKLIKLKLDRI